MYLNKRIRTQLNSRIRTHAETYTLLVYCCIRCLNDVYVHGRMLYTLFTGLSYTYFGF